MGIPLTKGMAIRYSFPMPKYNDAETKVCSKCHTQCPNTLEYFYSRPDRRGLMTHCKPCMRATSKAWRRSDPVRARESDRRDRLKRIAWNPKREIRLREEQDGKCAICQRVKLLACDHDHGRFIPRGMLCYGCNSALGKFQESPEIMLRAIGYLKKYATKEEE